MPVRPVPDTDWFPSRLDLRAAKRRERIRAAIVFNLFFVSAILMAESMRVHPLKDPVMVYVRLFCLFVTFFGVAVTFHSFVGTARRAQLGSLKGKGTDGCHVLCQIYDGAFLLGRDRGWLGRDEALLRFEGATTRFVVGAENLLQPVEGRELLVDVRGRAIRIVFTGESPDDKNLLPDTLHGWPRSETPSSEIRLPPSTPQPRSHAWYAFEVLIQTAIVPIVVSFVARFGQLLIPGDHLLLRRVLIYGPFVLYAIAFIPLMRRAKRREEAIIAALPGALESGSIRTPEGPTCSPAQEAVRG
ncbi:MAG: hypothetical protein ACO1SV_10575 [Fimbriimonas sp.]